MSARTPAIVWIGRVLSALPVLMLTMSGGMKLSQSAEVMEGFAKYGYPASTVMPLGAVELTCALLYAIPQTSVFGAILMTGYLGGATATHVSHGEGFFAPVIVGIIAWTGIGLRDARLRELLPIKRG